MQLLKYLLLGLGKPNLLSSQCCVWGVGENFLFLAPPYLCKSLSFLTNALWSPLLEMEVSGLYSLYFSNCSAMAVGGARAGPPPPLSLSRPLACIMSDHAVNNLLGDHFIWANSAGSLTSITLQGCLCSGLLRFGLLLNQ